MRTFRIVRVQAVRVGRRSSRGAICRKQNSGVLTRNPCPASTKELAGRLVHLWLTRLAVVVLASVVPTIARTGSLHPAGRRVSLRKPRLRGARQRFRRAARCGPSFLISAQEARADQSPVFKSGAISDKYIHVGHYRRIWQKNRDRQIEQQGMPLRVSRARTKCQITSFVSCL